MNTNEPKEIDLFDIFRQIGKWLKGIIKKFLTFLKMLLDFIIRKFIILVVITILTTIGSYYYFKISKTNNFYRTEMILGSKSIPAKELINHINNINLLIKDENINYLQTKFQLDSATVQKIKKIGAYWYIDQDNDNVEDYIDFSNNFQAVDSAKRIDNKIYVLLETFDNDLNENVKNSILYSIKNNEYFKKLTDNYILQNKNLLQKVEEEIADIDSLQQIIIQSSKKLYSNAGEKQILILNEKQPRVFNHEILTLFKEKQKIEAELNLWSKPVIVIKDFAPLKKPVKTIIEFGISSIIASLLITTLFLLIFDNRKSIIQYIKTTRNN